MSAEVIHVTFEQVVEGEEVEIPCEARRHEELGDGPAAYFVITDPAYSCCVPHMRFWCEGCLDRTLKIESTVNPCRCGRDRLPGPHRRYVKSVEPLNKPAA